ncbi:hypothetical protein EBU94_02830 [bacterium]|jgi:hypothetical protein|nr:hypothetical protein [bacterium]
MDSIAQIEAILHSKNKAIQHKEYAQKKAQHWHDIAQSFADQETLCGMLLNKNYVMNLHRIVENQEEISTQADAQPSENEEKQVENIQEPSVVGQEIQEEELSEENVNECATTKESVISKEVDVEA